MQVPGWAIGHAFVTALAYMAQFFLNEGGVPNTSGNLIQTFLQFVTFQNFAGLPDIFGFFLFMVFALPWLLLLGAALIPIIVGAMATTTGFLIVGIAVIVALVSVLVTFLV